MSPESETLGVVIAVAESDEAAAWLRVESAARHVAFRVGRRLRLDHAACEDLAHDATLVAVRDEFAALRRRDPDTPLAAWLAVCCDHLARERLRREHGERTGEVGVGDALAREEDRADGRVPPADATADVAELLSELTPVQRSVEEARLDAGSERKAAARLGVSRNRVHDIHRRAMKRLRAGPSAGRDDEAAWAASAAARAHAAGDDELARLLELVAARRTRREIAEALGITATAVRGRVSRARRWWGATCDS